MTREEYYTQRRIFRAAKNSINTSRIKDRPIKDKVFHFFWIGLYEEMPREIFESLADRRRLMVWKIDGRGSVLCNLKHAPNSYPHPTRNP